MKIICDNCRTKYSIADEKVKGKVFKIRCKKCSNIIVVRGNQQQGQEAEAQPAEEDFARGGGDFGEAPAWHLVIDQKQVGPMTGAEVRDRFARAEIDADTYVWREGFADWMRLAQVEDFADVAQATQVAGQTAAPSYPAEQPQAWNADAGGHGAGWGEPAAPAAWDAPAQGGAAAGWAAPEPERPGSDNLFGGQMADDPGRDLFASGHGQDAGPVFGSPAEPVGEGGLFGPPSAAPVAGGGELFGAPGKGNGQQLFPKSEEEPQPAQAQMTGARHENSVLFSLSNLQALAMGGKGPTPAAAGPGGPSDGSGLIDIRVMASAPSPAVSSGEGLPDLGGFAAPIAAAPVLIPAGSEDRPRWLLPALIGGGVILVGAITALVLVLAFRKPETVVVAAATPPVQQVGVQQPAAPVAPAAKAEPKAETPAAEAKTEGDTKPAVGKRRRPGGRRRAGVGKRDTSAPEEPPAASSTRERTPKRRDAIDDLIDGAIGGKKPSAGAAPAAARPRARRAASDDSALPETLSRAQIQAGMRGIKGKVQGCYDRYKVPGMANVQIRINTSGSVGSARVVGMFAGTPTGACVQAATKSASFDRFKGSPITITYPFILR